MFVVLEGPSHYENRWKGVRFCERLCLAKEKLTTPVCTPNVFQIVLVHEMPKSQSQCDTCPSPDPRGALAPTSGSAAVGGATVPIAGSTVQRVQLFLQAQEGTAHLF